MLQIFLIPLLGLQGAVAPQTGAEPALRVERAWVREAPPVAGVLAGYATFCNDGNEAVTLVGARSEAFANVEMHMTVETGDAVRMERTDSIAIAPNDCVEFAPGGRHFMLFDPVRPLRAGDEVGFDFQLADGPALEAVLPVRRADDMMHEHGHH